MSKSLKFTIEVNGLDLSEKAQADISKALNQTLMHKLGELDLTEGNTQKPLLGAGGNGNVVLMKYLVNGGRLMNVLSQELADMLRQVEQKNNIPTGAGALNVVFNQ